ncbi:MAG: DUF2147 domain-containing protein [Pseudomonadota bacterium]
MIEVTGRLRRPRRLKVWQIAGATAALSFGLASFGSAASANDITGVWYDDTGRGAVEIKSCGSSLCGRIVWLREPLKANGQPFTDELNPKASRRNRKICGLQVIGKLERQPDGSYDNGWIYDPKAGKAYNVAVSLKSRNRLAVTGYLGVKMLGRTLSWKRAPGDLPSCDASA